MDPRPGETNMVDVARLAGVSIATVSRALRDLPGVSATTRDRVRQIADELSYVVSPEASRLSRRMTEGVAIVVPRIDLWFYSAMLAGIEDVLRSADTDVLIYQIYGEEQRRRFFRQLPSRRKVGVVVLIALPLLLEEEQRLDLMGVSIVVAGGQIGNFPHVRADDRSATEIAMEHLFGLGHRKIGMIRTNDNEGTVWSSDLVRTKAYRDSLVERNFPAPDAYLVTAAAGVLAGAEGVSRLLALDDPPTAVLAFSDEIAIGALSMLADRGVAVPGQMSVIGIDGHPMGEVLGLSTVSQSVVRQGRLAGQMVLDLLAGGELRDASLIEPCELIVRRTTGPVPTG